MVIVFNHHPDNFMAIDCFFKGTIGWMDSRTPFKTIGGLDDHDPLVTNYTNSCLGHAIGSPNFGNGSRKVRWGSSNDGQLTNKHVIITK